MPKPDNYIIAWIDLETTGLDAHNGAIIEVAVVLTPQDASSVIGEYHAVLKAPRTHDPLWTERAREMHEASGLLKEALASSFEQTDADRDIAELFDKALRFGGELIIPAGRNPQFDMRWIGHHMPLAAALLDYHWLDITSVELALEQVGHDLGPFECNHRALDDVHREIERYQAALDLLAPIGEVE